MPILTRLISFDGTDGSTPVGGLITDAAGDLFGTTVAGGTKDLGTVFEIAKTSTGYASTPTTLVNFNGTDFGGINPEAGLIADAAGDLFGTTNAGGSGANGDGTVFEIAKTSTGYASTPTILASFNGSNGGSPRAELIADAAGDLFGTTVAGGERLDGTVFEIAKTSTGYASTPTTLITFSGSNGINPVAGLIADAAGDLFGTTAAGGANGSGTVFEIVKTASGYASTPTTLVSFNGSNGADPVSDLIADTAGDLFGTTPSGGAFSAGTVFEVANTASGYASTPITLITFSSTAEGESNPQGGLIADTAGDLFGTTEEGGAGDLGAVFEIAKTASGYAGTATFIDFPTAGFGPQGPTGNLIGDAAGDLFGATFGGGPNGDGTVFELGVVVSSGTVLEIPSGGFALGATVFGTLQIDAGGTASATMVSSGGLIDTFGSAAATVIVSGGSATVESGGVATFTTVSNGAIEIVSAGAMALGALLLGSGQHGVASGAAFGAAAEFVGAAGIIPIAGEQLVFGFASGTVVSGGALELASGGTATAATIDSGGTADTFGSALATIINTGGSETVHAGGVASATTVSGGAVETVSAGGTALGALLLGRNQQGIALGGAVAGANALSGGAVVIPIAGQQLVFGTASGTVIDGGTLVLENGGSLGAGAVSFTGTGGVFQVLSSTAPANVISGFGPGDVVDLASVAYSATDSLSLQADNMLALSAGGKTYDLAFDPEQIFVTEQFGFTSDGGGGTEIVLSAAGIGPGQTQTVSSGQSGVGIPVLSGGIAVVYGIVTGGTIGSTGQEYAQPGGTTSGVAILSGGDEFVESGGAATGTVVDGGSLVVYGSASGTILNDGSYLYLESGLAVGTVVSSGVEIVNGIASGTIDYRGGFDFVLSGGTALGTVLSGGEEYVELGATASGTIVSSGAQVVYGTVLGTVLDSGTSAYLEPGSIASGVTVNGALAVIYGAVGATTVEGGGFDYVEPGGTISGTVLSGGDEYVESGAAASGTVIDSGAEVVYGTTTGTVINGGSFEYVYPGGTASGTIVNSGVESIFQLAVGTIVNSGGEDFVNDGAASGTIVTGGDELVEFATSAVGTLVSGAGGAQFVYGSALNTTLVSGGEQVVEAVAGATAVNSGGYEYVASGGTAAGATIGGGTVELTSGAVTGAAIGFAVSGGGQLRLDDSQAFAGTVAGFGLPDQIDLVDIFFGPGTTLGFAEAAGNTSGTLTITDGTHTANLTLLGQYVAGQFLLASDGNGGTLVTDPPPGTATQPVPLTMVANHA